MCVTVKRPNVGTVRKHTNKKLNIDTKTANKSAKSDINQNNAIEDATSAHETSELSESTIQAFQNALHYRPLSQLHDLNDEPSTQNNGKPMNNEMLFDQQLVENTAENGGQNNNHVELNGGSGGNNNIENRLLFQGISLKDFEKHHKLMKEANLEKRKLLSNAIEQRY